MSLHTIFARKKPENFDFSSAESSHYITYNRIGDINANYLSYGLHEMQGCCGFQVLHSFVYASEPNNGNDGRAEL